MMKRRHFMALSGLAAGLASASPALADATPPSTPVPERATGKADAPVTVTEYFSLTCTHCAAFARDVFPQVRTELIDTGKVRYVWEDYPLDQVALLAAVVARSLPPDRYEPFVLALLGTQNRWAFNRDANPAEQIAQTAALAGMSRAAFDAARNNKALGDAILAKQAAASKRWGIDSTPTFLFSGSHAQNSKHVGEMTFPDFARAAAAVG